MIAKSAKPLSKQLEELIFEYVVESQRAATESLRAGFRGLEKKTVRSVKARRVRRTKTEISALEERLAQTVCANAGESMSVFAGLIRYDLNTSLTQKVSRHG